ncbi:hypothetical protein Rcae01_06207 [Novipirellula caenicola]|uniref:Immunity protein 22 n=2 Tax=Novipirellula caenicola TaxID=1536901 RepID=A0ABP9W3H0_9BACT
MAMNISHIWIGVFDSGAPDDYFVEHYSDDDDAPINLFAAEQDETFYDHDWLEISFVDASESTDVRLFVDGHSYSEDYLDAVVEKAAGLGIERINVFVLADKNEFSSPRSVVGEKYRLEYLGEFTCNT